MFSELVIVFVAMPSDHVSASAVAVVKSSEVKIAMEVVCIIPRETPLLAKVLLKGKHETRKYLT